MVCLNSLAEDAALAFPVADRGAAAAHAAPLGKGLGEPGRLVWDSPAREQTMMQKKCQGKRMVIWTACKAERE